MEESNAQTLTQEEEKTPVLKSFPKKDKKSLLFVGLGALAVVIVGLASGWLLTNISSRRVGSEVSIGTGTTGVKMSDKEAGFEDESEFPDEAEGVLREGGIDGDGSHHLERPGGESQYVYLTSTVIDLQAFVDKKVKVWGETISGKKAGWLMDVGKLKVVE